MNKIKTNRNHLVMQSVLGVISHPPMDVNRPYRISADGEPEIYPGTGGITYNARIGDNAVDWWADHVEPGVSIKHSDESRVSNFNGALQVLSCIGNIAKVVSGDAKGDRGCVTGKHGGVFHVMVDFTREQMEKMVIGDKIQIMAWGVGLKMTDFIKIKVMNLDPDLFRHIEITGDEKTGKIDVPVTHVLPAAIMGSGLGRITCQAGDYDIQMFDEEIVDKHKLNDMRFGDFVAITDADHSFGRVYRQNAIAIGVIVHSCSVLAGHGPGVTTLFSSKDGSINPVIDKDANLKNIIQNMEL